MPRTQIQTVVHRRPESVFNNSEQGWLRRRGLDLLDDRAPRGIGQDPDPVLRTEIPDPSRPLEHGDQFAPVLPDPDFKGGLARKFLTQSAQ